MSVPLTCIIIDDDDLDRLTVEAELANYDELRLIGSFGNCLEAISFFRQHRPDVLFTDVDMPEINGMEMIKTINHLGSINIIISSHPEYALQGFQLKAFDFILKPLTSDRFEESIRRVIAFNQLKNKAEAYDILFENEKIIFKEGHKIVNISAKEVIYLEAYGDYTKIVTGNKVYLTLITLSSFLESLPAGKFIRIHRSYAIAIGKVKCLNTKQVDMGSSHLPIGKTYLREIREILGNYMAN